MSYETAKSNIDKFLDFAGRVVDDATDIYHVGKEVAQDANKLGKEVKDDFTNTGGGTSSDFTPSPSKQEEREKEKQIGESWFTKFLKWFFGF